METITSSNANGASVAYTYDDLNRLATVVDNNLSGQNTTTDNYDPASNVATVATPNGLTSKFIYDTLNRLTELGQKGLRGRPSPITSTRSGLPAIAPARRSRAGARPTGVTTASTG